MNPSPETNSNHCAKLWVAGIVLFWFAFALFGSVLGLFDSSPRPSVALGAAVLLPVIAFIACFFGWSEFRNLVRSANLKVLTLAQTWRIGGIVFVILYYRRLLPATFALPAGWGDIAIGATAPLIAWAISSRTVFPKRLFLLWTVLGMLDLVMAITLGILSSATPLGIFAGETGTSGSLTTRIMSQFPLSLIPTFFVPLLLILHIISLIRVSREGSEVRSSANAESPVNRISQLSTINSN